MKIRFILSMAFLSMNASAIEVITPSDAGDYFEVIAPPKSVTMESGIVKKQQDKCGHIHSTGKYEEVLYIIEGAGEMRDGAGKKFPFKAGDVIYVGINTKHQVCSTNTTVLKYIYIAANTKVNK